MAAATPDGRIEPVGTIAVSPGDSVEFRITPDPGFHVARLLVDGRRLPPRATYVVRPARPRTTFAAEFERNTYRVNVAAGPNGSITPARPPALPHGGRLRLRVAPRPGYHVDSLYLDGTPLRPRAEVMLRDVAGPHDLVARFALNEYTLTVSAGVHARITPTGVLSVKHGESQTFRLEADPGYVVQEVLVDGRPFRASAVYTLNNVRDHHQIVARVSHPVATVLSPMPGETWYAGESREIHWQPFDDALADTGEVRVSFHGLDGPWQRVWRGALRLGSAVWTVLPIETDSLCVSVVKTAGNRVVAVDYADGFVHVRTAPASDAASRFFLRSVPTPAVAGPLRFEFSVPVPGAAAIELYTVAGRKVWRRDLGSVPAGERSIAWDGFLAGGTRVEPGIYFARLVCRTGSQKSRVVVLP